MIRVFLAVLLLQLISVSPLRAGEFSDFRIPKHKVWDLRGSGNLSYSGADNSAPGSSARQFDTQGSLAGQGYWLWDSDPYRLKLSGSTSESGDVTGNRSTSMHDTTTYQSKQDQKGVGSSTVLSVDGRCYPLQIPLGVFGGMSSSFTTSKFWNNSYNSTTYPAVFEENGNDSWQLMRQFGFSANAGVAWGRVRDASGVFDVWMIEQRLKETGISTRDLSAAARLKLTSLLYFGGDYSQIHDRPEKFFWQEVKNIFREDGALKDNTMDAYSVYRIVEPYFPGVSWDQSKSDAAALRARRAPRPASTTQHSLRESGWLVGVMARGSHYHDFNKIDNHYYQTAGGYHSEAATSEWSMDYFSFGPQVEYHRPLGWRWQFDGSSVVLFPQKSGSKAIDASTSLQASYLIADRWWGQAVVNHSRYHIGSNAAHTGGHYDEWSISIAAALSYYIEDRLSADLRISQSQWGGHQIHSDGTAYGMGFSRSNLLTLGLSYHFTGGLEAPGVVLPSRLLSRSAAH